MQLKGAISSKIQSILQSPDLKTLTDTELLIELEKHEYDMNSPKDVLTLVNKSAVAMDKIVKDSKDANLLSCIKQLVDSDTFLVPEETDDQHLEKLARVFRKLRTVKKELLALKKSLDADKSGIRFPTRDKKELLDKIHLFLDIADVLKIQIKSTAKLSLHNKIRAAHAQHVRTAWEEGHKQSFSFHIEAGPEFSILNQKASLGIHASFTYTYALNVAHPYGNIQVANTFEVGANFKGNFDFGIKSDSLAGGFSLDGAYTQSSIRSYSTPEALTEAESGMIFKQIMHYMKPVEIPKSESKGFKGAFASAASKIKNTIVSKYHSLKTFFSKSSAQAAKEALLNNEKFKLSLHKLGVFNGFDSIKRASVNKALQGGTTIHGANASLAGNLKFKDLNKLSFVKGISAKAAYKYKYSKSVRFEKCAELMNSSYGSIENFLKEEYASLDKTERQKIKKEAEQYRETSTNPLAPKELMQETLALIDEFHWFCQLTCKDDLAKSGLRFHSPKNPERLNLMNDRGARNRGDYLRAVLTRALALKYQVMTQQQQQKQDQLIEEPPEPSDNEEILNIVNRMLDALGKELANPPVMLSKNNQRRLNIEHKTTSKSTDISIGIGTTLDKAILPQPPAGSLGPLDNIVNLNKQSDIVVNSNLNIHIPHQSTQAKFFGGHTSATLSLSVTGDKLLQYTPQVVSNIIIAIREKLASQDHTVIGEATHAIVESLKDFSANIAHDLEQEKLTELVNDAIKSRQVLVDGKNVSLDHMLKFKALHQNTFTISVNIMGTKTGLRYGGLNITNSRNKVYSVEAKIPVTGIVSIGGQAQISMGSTTNVLSTLGADSFAPLVGALRDVTKNPLAFKSFVSHHKKALDSMAADYLKNGTKLNEELKSFIKFANEKCLNSLGDIHADDNSKENLRAISKAKTFTEHAAAIIAILKEMPEGNGILTENFFDDFSNNVAALMTKTIKLLSPSRDDAEIEQQVKDVMDNAHTLLLPTQETNSVNTLLNLASLMQAMEPLY